MEIWEEPISFTKSGAPSDALTKAKKAAIHEAQQPVPIQVNPDGSIEPLNADGTSKANPDKPRGPMTQGPSEGWKVKDPQAFESTAKPMFSMSVNPAANNFVGKIKGVADSFSKLSVGINQSSQKIAKNAKTVLDKFDMSQNPYKMLELHAPGEKPGEWVNYGKILQISQEMKVPTEYPDTNGITWQYGPSITYSTIQTVTGTYDFTSPGKDNQPAFKIVDVTNKPVPMADDEFDDLMGTVDELAESPKETKVEKGFMPKTISDAVDQSWSNAKSMDILKALVNQKKMYEQAYTSLPSMDALTDKYLSHPISDFKSTTEFEVKNVSKETLKLFFPNDSF